MDIKEILTQSKFSIQFLEELFDKTNVGFFAKDLDCKIISINKYMLPVFSVEKKEDVLGKTDMDFFPSHIATPFIDDDKYVMKEREIIQDRLEMVPMHNFKLYWMKTSKYPFYNEKNEVVGMLGITVRLKEAYDSMVQNTQLEKVMIYIEENIHNKISLDDLAEVAMMSKNSLLRNFKETFKISPVAYMKRVRIHLACKMLRHSDKDMLSIANECGFYDQSHFNKEFKAMLDITPRKYKMDLA